MGIKRYVIFAAILIVICGIYVYTLPLENANFSNEFFGIPITLPVAVWVALPMVVLAVLSVFHMMYYGMKAYIINRSLSKDYDTFIASSKSTLLGEEYNPKFKTKWYKLPNEMLKAIYSPKDGLTVLSDESLRQVCVDIASIKEGDYVDLKFYKLKSENPLVIQNKLNQLKNDPKIATDILRNCSTLESKLCEKAYDSLIQHASYTEIKKQNHKLRAKDILVILQRSANDDDDLFIEDNETISLVEDGGLNSEEYLQAVKILKNKLNPDTLVTIFENIFHKDSTAGKAYIYALFDLQMLDKAREVLDNADDDEYQMFKIYLFLRDNGKNIDIDYML